MSRHLRALQHRNYQLFFSGQLVSLTGTWMQLVAESWLVYRLTGSATLLGIAAFASQFPVFLFATVGGAVADRTNRHRIIVTTQTLSMIMPLVLAALTLSGHVRVWHVFALASCLGLVNAFDIPARQAFMMEMVGREDLSNAIALNSSMVNGARIVGPALAGLLVAAVGEGWCFLLNGMSYLAVIAGLLMMKLPPRQAAHAPGSALREAVAGFHFAGRTAPIRALLLLVGVVSLAGLPYSVLMPVFANSILGGGARTLGLLMGASGLGAFAGAVALTTRQGARGLGLWAAIAGISFGFALIAFAESRVLWLSVVLLVAAGTAMMVQMASCNTLIQAMVPDELRGRVMALFSMMFMGMSPIGSLLAGWLAERIGAPSTVVLGGAVCVAAAGIFAWRRPTFRTEAHALILAQEMGAGPISPPV